MRYQLTLEAEKLKRAGRLRMGSPYAVVTVMGGPNEGLEVGRTETIETNLSPNWTKVLFVESDPSVFYPIRVAIFDDNPRGDDTLMAEASFEITELYESPGNMQYEELQGGTIIRAHIEQSMMGSTNGMVKMQFRALDVKNVEPGMLGLGLSDPFYELAKKNVNQTNGTVRWNVVYRSETIPDNLNPYWKEHELSLEELCYGDLEWPLRLSVLDWQKKGKHRIIGKIDTDIGTLQRHVCQIGTADRSTALQLTKEGKDTTNGLLVVLKFDIEQE